MTTFSQLVDKMVLETKRADMRPEIATYLNQTIREVHSDPQTNNIAHFESNLREDLLVANSAENFSWAIPRPSCFQAMKAIRYDSVYDRLGNQVWARIMVPGRQMNDQRFYAYRSGQTFYFRGYGGLNALISLAWYEFPPSCEYYPPGPTRPAEYNESAGWTYAAAYNVDDTTRAAARQLVSNWILLRWPMLLEEGVRAKVYKRVSDDVRARTSYSLYQQQHRIMYSSEVGDVAGSWPG